MDEPPAASFGELLRQQWEQEGLTLTEFARRVAYSKGYVSKICNGRRPSQDFARRCDAVLGTGPTFTDLVPTEPRRSAPVPAAHRDELWVMSLSREGSYQFGSRLAGDTTAIMFWGSDSPASYPPTGTGAVPAYRAIFDQLRMLGQAVGPAELVPSLVAGVNALCVIAARAPERERGEALRLASRFAEYTGWLAQEKGDERAAQWWTDRAVELATEGGDDELLAYAFVRRALIALYRHDPWLTVELAQQAQRGHKHLRVLGLGAQREAQGHAIAGDELACRRLLDRAANLFAEARVAGAGDAPVLGTSALEDPVVTSTAWCLYELGDYGQTVEILMPALDRIPARAERAHARYGARLALALARLRELEQACVVLDPILSALPRIDSATIREDIVSVARTLGRWRTAPVVRQIMPRLHTALRTELASSQPSPGAALG